MQVCIVFVAFFTKYVIPPKAVLPIALTCGVFASGSLYMLGDHPQRTGDTELKKIRDITGWSMEGLYRVNGDPTKSLNDFLVAEAMEVVVLEKGFDEVRHDNRVTRDSLVGVGVFWKEANAKFDHRLSELQDLFPMLAPYTRAECFKKAQAELKL